VVGDGSGVAIADIIIGDNIEAVGQKLYYNRMEFDVNVAPYVEPQLEVVPLKIRGLGKAPKRTVKVSVRVDGERSPKVIMAAGAQGLDQGVLLSASNRRTIALGQYDEIAFIPTSPEVWVSITVVDKQGRMYAWRESPYLVDGDGVLVYGVDASQIMADAKEQVGVEAESIVRFDVTILFGMTEAFTVRYDVKRTTQGVRLSWINRYGAIDSYTFPTINSANIVCDREGRVTLQSAWREIALSSEIMPRKQVEWLAEVVTSPRVWMVEGGGLQECEVLSKKIEVDNVEVPCAVKIVVKPTKEIFAQ
jgi:hypothetical protein